MNLVLVLVPTSTHTSPTIRTILLRSCQGGDRGFQVKQVIGKADLHSISIIFSKPFVVYSHKNYLLCPEKSSPFLVDKVEYPRPVDFKFIPPTHPPPPQLSLSELNLVNVEGVQVFVYSHSQCNGGRILSVSPRLNEKGRLLDVDISDQTSDISLIYNCGRYCLTVRQSQPSPLSCRPLQLSAPSQTETVCYFHAGVGSHYRFLLF